MEDRVIEGRIMIIGRWTEAAVVITHTSKCMHKNKLHFCISRRIMASNGVEEEDGVWTEELTFMKYLLKNLTCIMRRYKKKMVNK